MQDHERNALSDEENELNNVVKRLDSLTYQFERHRNETSVVLNELVNIYESRKRPLEIDQLIQENRSFKETNKTLQAELDKCIETLTKLNSEVTDNESEKPSLLTVIRLLNEEQENISCTSKKYKSCQEHQTRNLWRVADTKTKSRRVHQQINL